MATGTPSISTRSTCALEETDIANLAAFDANSLHLEYESESMQMVQTHTSPTAIRGTRSKPSTRPNIASEAVGGSISLYPTAAELTVLLPYIMGAGAGPFTLAETLPVFSLYFDRIAQQHVYQGCKVARATFSCSQSQPMMLTMDILGLSELITTAARPTLAAIDADDPSMMWEMTYTCGFDVSATEAREFSVVIDNGLDGGRFLNSITRTAIPETDRTVSGTLVVPYTGEEIALYDTAIAGSTLEITMQLTGFELLFDFANIKIPAESPVSGSRGSEIVQTLNFMAYETAAAKELIISLV